MFVRVVSNSAEHPRAHGTVRWLGAILASLLFVPLASAQDWGDDSSEDWSAKKPAQTQPARSSSSASSRYSNSATGWSVQGGFGFTASPETFLLNFEAPYAFNEWVSAGPTLQVGLQDNHKIVAPTGSIRLTVPDMPGRDFDRLHPYIQTGLGFAYLDKDHGRRDGDGASVLVNMVTGVEYQVSEKIFLTSQMMFNFLPSKVHGEEFFYSWQIGGIRFKF